MSIKLGPERFIHVRRRLSRTYELTEGFVERTQGSYRFLDLSRLDKRFEIGNYI